MITMRLFVVLLILSVLCAPALAQTCSVPSFIQPSVYPVGTDVRSVATADFDGDGRSDLAVANADASTVTVVLKAGTAQPGIVANYAVGHFR
jgi:hypothetical protein